MRYSFCSPTSQGHPWAIMALAVAALVLVFLVIGLDPAYDLSRQTQHLSPEQRAEAEQLYNDLVTTLEQGNNAEAEKISKQIDQLANTVKERLGKAQSKVICAWCETEMGISDTPEDTHSICQQCKDIMLEGWED